MSIADCIYLHRRNAFARSVILKRFEKYHRHTGSSGGGNAEAMCTRRSRRSANLAAIEKLNKVRINNDDVTDVLDRWSFSQNTRRINVIPCGATAVQSDTLGLVRTRTGKVVPTAMTKRYHEVFHLLCRWQKEHQPPCFAFLFPCTSISINRGYAAKKHRDSYNVGPSMTMAFGAFTGGELLYWPNDDGSNCLEDLSVAGATAYESKRQMVLFDGKRCHAVTRFQGILLSSHGFCIFHKIGYPFMPAVTL